jgi:hypothetical protein
MDCSEISAIPTYFAPRFPDPAHSGVGANSMCPTLSRFKSWLY